MAQGIEVLRKELSRLLLSGLILLLGIQLTGLSCLDEWQDLLLIPGHQIHSQVRTGTPGDVGLGNDGCPCHLAFVSAPYSTHELSAPPSLLNPGAPVTNPSAHPFLLFRPPLSL